ncbi:type II and III secretion system protein [Gemmatirosa kalamazoonensis]|uniref:Type II and III secretion system protein n=1 Tax=Gemmatirosa kalamazoonensis TaxID=861299 RepID=W0RME6_9BACT|nr:secretin N-terminal domain-containing protein [Gemmatirosa kalamazoonensis]AHG91941.1 type II and III secretion system protein [Gemmatirosa kalamazoonensis]
MSRRRARRLLVLAVALAAHAPSPTPLGAQQPVRPAAPVRVNFVGAPLADVIRSLASTLGLTVILSEVPDRRVTFSTPGPVRPDDVAAILESILESNGLVLVQRGGVAQVTPADKAPAVGVLGTGFDFPSPPPLGLVTQLVPLQAIRADEAADALRRIASPTARIEPVARSNALLVTDRGVNVARYLDLLRRLDARPEGEAGLRTYVVPLRYASAEDLATALGSLFGVSTGGARGGSLADRSLSRTLDAFRDRELDAFRQRQGVGLPGVPTSATPSVSPSSPIERQVAPGAPPNVPRDSASAAAALAATTTVVASTATNSLVIRTLPPNFPLLRETIEALDVRPPQVLFEVTVAEVQLGRGTEFGIDWAAASRKSGATYVQQNAAVADTVSSVTGLVIRKVFTFDNLDVRALLRAVATTTNVNVLSTPEVLAVNNREARILVGSKVPFVAAQRLANDVALDRAVQYQDVGTALTIVPTINEDGYVSVQILQEVSALTTQTLPFAFGAPVISTREAATRAVVRDGQTIVIGGLIGDTRQTNAEGIPFLMDIPLLGNLFRHTRVTRDRTELAIFVTPYVVRTDADADRLRDRARERLDRTPGTIRRP